MLGSDVVEVFGVGRHAGLTFWSRAIGSLDYRDLARMNGLLAREPELPAIDTLFLEVILVLVLNAHHVYGVQPEGLCR